MKGVRTFWNVTVHYLDKGGEEQTHNFTRLSTSIEEVVNHCNTEVVKMYKAAGFTDIRFDIAPCV